jgi:hypothetical protein
MEIAQFAICEMLGMHSAYLSNFVSHSKNSSSKERTNNQITRQSQF